MAASRPIQMAWLMPVELVERQMDATLAAVRAPTARADVVARRATASTAAVDKQLAARAERTARQMVDRAAAVMGASGVSAAMVVMAWCPQQIKRRFQSELPAEQVSRVSPGVQAVVEAVGSGRSLWPVVAVVAQAQAGPLAAEPSVVVVAAARSASMLLASTAW